MVRTISSPPVTFWNTLDKRGNGTEERLMVRHPSRSHHNPDTFQLSWFTRFSFHVVLHTNKFFKLVFSKQAHRIVPVAAHC